MAVFFVMKVGGLMRIRYLFLCGAFLVSMLPQAAKADCTLALTAVCDGVACAGRAFKPGQIIYNQDHGLAQVCLADGSWKALHKAPPNCPNIGDTCFDGTKYAGALNGIRLYVTPEDQATTGVSYGTAGFATGEVSLTDGKTNTDNLYAHVMAGDGTHNPPPDDPPSRPLNAAVMCHDLVAHGHDDWYLPADSELEVLMLNSAVISGFADNYYWSSSEQISGNARVRRPVTGTTNRNKNNANTHVRCVRH